MTIQTNIVDDFSLLPELPEGVFTAPLQKPDGLGDDWIEPKQADYGRDDDAIWDDLFARQVDILPGRAASAFMAGLEKLDLSRGGVPEFARLSAELGEIRTRETFDYIQEPDVFHDVFGHVPMLTDPVFADYMQEYGRAGWKAMRYNRLKALGSLYWYTVEFGLIEEAPGDIRAYGAGILSGPAEAQFAVEAQSPNRADIFCD